MPNRRSRRLPLLLTTAALVLGTPAAAFAAPGDPDTDYGSQGRTVTTFAAGSASASEVLFLPGDKALVVGGAGFGTSARLALARYTSAGQPDDTFGGDGRAEVAYPEGSSSISAATLWSAGTTARIAAAGGLSGARDGFMVAALKPDGTPDTTFAGDGFQQTPLGTDVFATVGALVPQTAAGGAAKLIAAGDYSSSTGSGVALVRYGANGAPDTTFGDQGKVLDPAPAGVEIRITDAALLANGDLVVVGSRTHEATPGQPETRVTQLYAARYTALSGYAAKDPDFGDGGEVVTRLGGDSARATAVLTGPGDSLTVSGSYSPAGESPRMLVARFDGAGDLDTTFGAGDSGRTLFSFGAGFAFADDLARDPEGRILLVGQHVTGSGSLALARVLDTGEPDQGFASGGARTTSFGADAEGTPVGVGVQSDGKVVIGGTEFANRGTGFSGAFLVARYLGGTTQTFEPPQVQITAPVAGEHFNATETQRFTGTLANRPGAGDAQEVTVRIYRVQGTQTTLAQTLAATVTPASGDQSSPTWAAEPSSLLADGTWEVEATQPNASAGAGTSERVRFKVDRATPAPAVTSPVEGADVGGESPVFRGTRGTQAEDQAHSADSPDVFVTICPLGAPSTECVTRPATGQGGEWTVEPVSDRPDGTYTVVALQSDGAGNEGRSAPVTFRLDRTAPALDVESPANGSLVGTRTPVIGGPRGMEAADASHSPDERDVTVKLRRQGETEVLETLMDTSTEGTWAVLPLDPLADGTYDVEATQSDGAGNVTVVRSSFLVDDTAPALGLGDPANGSRSSSRTPALTGTRGVLQPGASHGADAPRVTVRLYRGEALQQTLTDDGTGDQFAVTPAELGDGEYAWEAEQADEAGNLAATPRRTFSVDTQPPAPVIESPADGSTVAAGDVVFTGRGSVDDPREVVVTARAGVGGTRIGRGTVGDDGRWSVTVRLGGGLIAIEDYTAWVTQKDEAGNEGRSPSIALTVGESQLDRPPARTDQAGPQISIRTPQIGQRFTQNQAVNADYACSDDVQLVSCTGPVRSGARLDTSRLGEHRFEVVARDAAGHETRTMHGYFVIPAPGSEAEAQQLAAEIRKSVDEADKEIAKLVDGKLFDFFDFGGKGVAVPATGQAGDTYASAILGQTTSNGTLKQGVTAPIQGGKLDFGRVEVPLLGGRIIGSAAGNLIGAAAGNLIGAAGGNLLSDNGLGRRPLATAAARKGKRKRKRSKAKRAVVIAVGSTTLKQDGTARYRIRLTKAGRKAMAERRAKAKKRGGSRRKPKPITLTLATAGGRADGSTPGVITARRIRLR